MESPKTLKTLLDEAENLIQNGNLSRASRMISDISIRGIPDGILGRFAGLCRRLGMYHRGISAFQPILKRTTTYELDPKLRSEYAVLLQRRGAIEEALRLLESINPEEAPEASLYRAFCLFNLWRYEEAIPILKQYCTSDISEYQRKVGALNLTAAFAVIGDLTQAKERAEAGIASCQTEGLKRLEANYREVLSQVYIKRGQLDQARNEIELAMDILKEVNVHDVLFLEKWLAIASALEINSLEPLLKFKKIATSKVEFETLRDIDLYTLKMAYDPELHKKLHWGTPFKFYRKRIAELLAVDLPPGPVRFGANPRCEEDLDLLKILESARFESKLTEGTEKAMYVLCSDLYQPFRLGRVFSALFPDEKFNASSSPPRVGMVLKRLEEFLAAHGIRNEIVSHSRGYYLSESSEVTLVIDYSNWQPDRKSLDQEQMVLDALMRNADGMTVQELSAELSISVSSARTQLLRLVEKKRVHDFRLGRVIRYSIASTQS